MIKNITERLYSDIPEETLYHYTTFKGLLGIVQSGVLWASDIRYMNDSAELKHTANLIRQEITQRIANGSSRATLLNQFIDWVTHRITNGHMLFAASFRSNGNLLSQWRGYSSIGKGVSLGFGAQHIRRCSLDQSFQIGKCVYDPDLQQDHIRQVVDAVENIADEHDIQPASTREDYHRVFEVIESDLLRIAAILKHPSFKEEEEWRVISPVITDHQQSAVKFREGTSMLVPYLEFNLQCTYTDPLSLDHIFLGPTMNINQSMNSLTMYLSRNGIQLQRGIDYCDIPYRQK